MRGRAFTPKDIGLFGAPPLPRNSALLVHRWMALKYRHRVPTGLMGSSGRVRRKVTAAYHHSLKVTESQPRWLLLSLPPRAYTTRLPVPQRAAAPIKYIKIGPYWSSTRYPSRLSRFASTYVYASSAIPGQRALSDVYGPNFGANSRNRTRDRLLTKQPLYRLSYVGMVRSLFGKLLLRKEWPPGILIPCLPIFINTFGQCLISEI